MFLPNASSNGLFEVSPIDTQGNIKSRSRFTSAEDEKLKNLVEVYGTNSWAYIANQMPNRNPRQCHERWTNFLSPLLNHGPWTQEEDDLLEQKVNEFGNKWVTIQQYFPDRTDTSIKNRYKLILRRKENGGKRRSQKRKLSVEQQTIEEPKVAQTSHQEAYGEIFHDDSLWNSITQYVNDIDNDEWF